MDDRSAIQYMLSLHKAYRESYIMDLESEKKYKVLCMLMKKEVNNGMATYKLEKNIMKKQRILDFHDIFKSEKIDVSDTYLERLWSNSLCSLLQYTNNICDFEACARVGLEGDKNILEIGKKADTNRDKIEYDKLKIQLMNKKRRV